MAGSIVAMEFIVLAVLLEFFLVLVDLGRTGRAVFVAEDTEQRAGQVFGELNRRNRLFLRPIVFRLHDPAAPEVDAGVDAVGFAGVKESLPAAGATADYADFAGEIRLHLEPLHRTFGIADHLGVGNTTLGASLRSDVRGVAFSDTLVEVVADRRVTVVGETAGCFAIPFVPAGQMVD